MSTNVVAQNEIGANPFRRYFIPAESRWVRFVMQKAGEYSRTGNVVTSRAFSVACSIAATVLSVFNTFIYFLQAPLRVLLNVVRFSPIRLVANFVSDLTNSMLSLVFASLGVAFVIMGALLPAPVFMNFAPEKELTLEGQNKQLREDLENRDQEIERLNKKIATLGGLIQEADRELEETKLKLRAPPKKKGWF